jgi:hypothetical protein
MTIISATNIISSKPRDVFKGGIGEKFFLGVSIDIIMLPTGKISFLRPLLVNFFELKAHEFDSPVP